MITAVDTNVLMDILAGDEFFDFSAAAIQRASDEGLLVASDVVYAELCCHFQRQASCDGFLESLGIRVQPLTREAHFTASRVWREYRRRGGKRERILPDFLVGAHAAVQAHRLLSRDQGFYAAGFAGLAVWDPLHG